MNLHLRTLLALNASGGLLVGVAEGADWSPAEAPLMTPWADKVDPANVLPEYPRPLMVRPNWQSLNGLWQFDPAEQGDAVPVDRELGRRILVPFPWESALSGVRQEFESRRAWYRRGFVVPQAWGDHRVMLHFGAVDWEAIVYVNGRCVGSHRGGYDGFSFDITPFLRDRNRHELVVGVWDPGNSEGIAAGKQANDRFLDPHGYSYCPASGIWQTVWLEPVPERFIQDIHTVPDLDTGQVHVTVNPDSQAGDFQAEVIVWDGQREVGRASGPPNQPIPVSVPQPRAWWPEDPHLYDLEVILNLNGKRVDAVTSYFGMRKIAIEREVINGRDGLMKVHLNNRFVFQMGPLDQGFWPDGIYTAPTDEALRWDAEQIKATGFNMVRKHIKVEPQRWYYWCDKLGLLVWQDMPSTFKKRTEEEKTQFELELQRMIKTHWNHPSIVNWIVFNEHWGAYDVERLTELVVALDPSRLVTGNSGMDAGRPHIDYEVGHLKDNHHYRPPTNPMANNRRAAVNGEYGAIGYLLDGHVWDVDGPWVHYNYENKDKATDEYENFIQMVVKFRREDHLSGAVYTQWTDLENEMNGVYTYDRKEPKLHLDRVRAANEETWRVVDKESSRDRAN